MAFTIALTANSPEVARIAHSTSGVPGFQREKTQHQDLTRKTLYLRADEEDAGADVGQVVEAATEEDVEETNLWIERGFVPKSRVGLHTANLTYNIYSFLLFLWF